MIEQLSYNLKSAIKKEILELHLQNKQIPHTICSHLLMLVVIISRGISIICGTSPRIATHRLQ